jgi:hypothetical protein
MYVLMDQHGNYVASVCADGRHTYVFDKGRALTFERYVDVFNARQFGERILYY